MKESRNILLIILAVFVFIVVVQNHGALSTEVTFKLDLLSIDYQTAPMSLYHIVTITFLFAVLVTGLIVILEHFHLRKELKTLANTARQKDEELNSLRNLPITAVDASTEEPHETEESNDTSN